MNAKTGGSTSTGVRTSVVVIVVVILLAGVAWMAAPMWASSQTADGEIAAKPIKRVVVSVTEAGSVAAPELFTRYRGDVRARRSSDLALRRSGRLTEINVHEGDVVSQGEVLAELQTDDLDAEAALADAAIRSAEAALEEAVAGPRYQTLRAAAAKVRQLEAQADSARQRLERQETLQRRGAGSDQAFDDAKFEFDRLQAAVNEATSTLDELQEGTRSEQIDAARALFAAAKARRQQIDVDRDDSRIIAPDDAIIARRWVDEGVIVSPNQTVLSIIEVPPLEARVDLPADVASTLQRGQTLPLDVGGRTFESTVIRLQPSVDPVLRTRTIDVRFDPSPDRENLVSDAAMIGQTASLRLPFNALNAYQQSRGTQPTGNSPFWIPSASLARGVRGLWSVYVAAPDDEASLMNLSDGVPATIQRRDVRVLQT
ncbi:MAG: HlyD family efflux transporter periplasmic adaptor subunit, partial [Planctomycetota bacterium]